MKYGRRTTSVARQQAAKQLAEQNESDFTDWLPLLGTAAGGALAIPTGGLSAIAGGAALGGGIGSSIDALADGNVARMGQGAMGLAQLADNPKSAEIIKRVLRGYGGDTKLKMPTDFGGKQGVEWDLT